MGLLVTYFSLLGVSVLLFFKNPELIVTFDLVQV
jgi:hypothetical protein